ncbi:MAG: hypothetical protein ACYDDF_05320 [Thermoplasmatota archaeon]
MPDGMKGIMHLAIGIVVVIVAAVVGLTVLAALLPTYTGSVRSIGANLTNANWGSTTANSISNIFGTILVPLLGLFAIVGLIFAAVYINRHGEF